MRPGSGNAGLRSMVAETSAKMVVLAAMPSASVPTVAAVKSGRRTSRLAAPRRSWIQPPMRSPPLARSRATTHRDPFRRCDPRDTPAPGRGLDVAEAHFLELAVHLLAALFLDDAAV